MMKEHPKLDIVGKRPSISDWGEKVKEVDTVLGNELQEDKRIEFQKIEDMGLPCYKRFILPIDEFLNDPQGHLDTLKTGQNYVFFYPSKKRETMPKNEVIDYVKKTIALDPEGCQEILVQEYKENEFGGNIIINHAGQISVEMKHGSQGPVSAGTEVPEFTAETDVHTGTFKYSTDDPKIRQIIFNTIKSIHHDENRYLPGYYEFHMVKNDEGTGLEPVFVDYKNKKPYLEKVKKRARTGD